MASQGASGSSGSSYPATGSGSTPPSGYQTDTTSDADTTSFTSGSNSPTSSMATSIDQLGPNQLPHQIAVNVQAPAGSVQLAILPPLSAAATQQNLIGIATTPLQITTSFPSSSNPAPASPRTPTASNYGDADAWNAPPSPTQQGRLSVPASPVGSGSPYDSQPDRDDRFAFSPARHPDFASSSSPGASSPSHLGPSYPGSFGRSRSVSSPTGQSSSATTPTRYRSRSRSNTATNPGPSDGNEADTGDLGGTDSEDDIYSAN